MAFMAAVAPVLSVVSGVIGAVGAFQQADAAAKAAEYQAQVARNNAKAAQDMRRYEIMRGLTEAEEQDRANAEQRGKQRAAMAASGFDMNEGTMREIGVSQTVLGRTDSLRRAHAGELAGWKLQNQANSFMAEAGLAEFKADTARSAGLLSGFGTLIGAASQFAPKWSFTSTPAAPPKLGTPSVYGTLY